jgi:hypothetical protein
VRVADRVDQGGDEGHVVDVVAVRARAGELTAVVPVLLDAFRERHQEPLAVGQDREARQPVGARAGAAAPVEDQHERGGGGADRRRHVQVIAPGDPVDLEGVGREGPLRRGRDGDRHERGQDEGERPGAPR